MILQESLNSKYDLCIIGGGAAGIILALEFTLHNPYKKVLLVEYGKKGNNKENNLDNSIKNFNPTNHHNPYECTNKGLGGTTVTWGGRCVMYNEIDFLDRPILDGQCTWNVNLFKEINIFLPITANYFECGNAIFNLNNLPAYANQRIAEGFKEGIVTDSMLERWSKPTRFGQHYNKELTHRNNLTILQGYEARNFSSPDNKGFVSRLEIAKVNSKDFITVSAKYFVIAAGAQESTRILLRNKNLFSNLSNIPQALGKYYQGHLSGKIASVKFKGNPKKTDFYFKRDIDGTYIRRRFQFSQNCLIKENLLNIAIWLDNPLYYNPEHGSGTMSLMYLAMLLPVLGKKLAPPAIAHSITKGKKYAIKRHLINILKGLPFSLITPATIFFKRYFKHRKLPGIFLYSPDNYYALHFHSEQIPVESSCMKLGLDGETLEIHYSISETDVDSVIKSHDILDNYLKSLNCGELEYWYPKINLKQIIYETSRDGIHQTGTTRIADSVEKGVVDKNLKLFGTNNIFVCSSSVFPTSGQANPTFLLGAFAIRLSNYLTNINEDS
jgi:choline dehydrogenase-like flavoprotein